MILTMGSAMFRTIRHWSSRVQRIRKLRKAMSAAPRIPALPRYGTGPVGSTEVPGTRSQRVVGAKPPVRRAILRAPDSRLPRKGGATPIGDPGPADGPGDPHEPRGPAPPRGNPGPFGGGGCTVI